MASPFDRNLLPEFESIRGTNERILWTARPVFVPFLVSGAFAGSMSILFGVTWVLTSRSVGSADGLAGGWGWFWLFGLLPLVQGTWAFVGRMLAYSNTRYAYSDRRVMMRSGFFGTDFKTIDYDKISDLEVTVNLVERLYNVGTIRFYSGRTQDNDGSVTRLYDYWHSVPNPYEVFRQVKEVMVDIKTDYQYPNALRPETNPGYPTRYTKE
jgi:hypothetical protein